MYYSYSKKHYIFCTRYIIFNILHNIISDRAGPFSGFLDQYYDFIGSSFYGLYTHIGNFVYIIGIVNKDCRFVDMLI